MTSAPTIDLSAEPQEYIAFHVGGQSYCIDIMSVKEIRGWTPATPLPDSPSFVQGVINLRGAVLPVLDLADRLGLPVKEPTARHAIIVVQNGDQLIGLLVEAVSKILMLSPASIQSPPEIAADASRGFIKGIVATENEVISVLVIKNLLADRHAIAA